MGNYSKVSMAIDELSRFANLIRQHNQFGNPIRPVSFSRAIKAANILRDEKEYPFQTEGLNPAILTLSSTDFFNQVLDYVENY